MSRFEPCRVCKGERVIRIPRGMMAMGSFGAQRMMNNPRPVVGTIRTGMLWWKRETEGIVAWEVDCYACVTSSVRPQSRRAGA